MQLHLQNKSLLKGSIGRHGTLENLRKRKLPTLSLLVLGGFVFHSLPTFGDTAKTDSTPTKMLDTAGLISSGGTLVAKKTEGGGVEEIFTDKSATPQVDLSTKNEAKAYELSRTTPEARESVNDF